MKKQTKLQTQRVTKKSSKGGGILIFSAILYICQRLFLYRDIYNVPVLKSIFLLILLGFIFYSLLNLDKIISMSYNVAFKGVGKYIALFVSIGSTLIGISNQIYASNQEMDSARCRIIYVSEGSGRLSSNVQIDMDGMKVDLVNTFNTGIIRKLESDKKILSNSYINLTFRNGLFGMIKVEDANIIIN